MYRFVSTDVERNIIKNASGKWIPYRDGRVGNVVVYEHVDSKDFISGWYKTVTKVKNQDGTYTNWVRFYKRVGAKK